MSDDNSPTEVYWARCGCLLGSLVPHGGEYAAQEDAIRAEYLRDGGFVTRTVRLYARHLMTVTPECAGHRYPRAS